MASENKGGNVTKHFKNFTSEEVTASVEVTDVMTKNTCVQQKIIETKILENVKEYKNMEVQTGMSYLQKKKRRGRKKSKVIDGIVEQPVFNNTTDIVDFKCSVMSNSNNIKLSIDHETETNKSRNNNPVISNKSGDEIIKHQKHIDDLTTNCRPLANSHVNHMSSPPIAEDDVPIMTRSRINSKFVKTLNNTTKTNKSFISNNSNSRMVLNVC